MTFNDPHHVHQTLITEYEGREVHAKQDGFDLPKLGTPECLKLMLDALGPNPAVLIVDAVDEIHVSCQHKLLDALCEVVKKSTSVVKIFVTSRSDNNVFALLPEALAICIHSDDNQLDMELFVAHRINHAIQSRRLLNGDVSDSLREYLVETLSAKAEEM